LEDAASYLDGCAFNAKARKPQPAGEEMEHRGIAKVAAERIKKWRYQAKVRIQLCAILSQLNKHEAAQYHAKKAAKYADNVIAETHKVCSEHLKRHKKLLASGRLKSKALERPQYQLMESPHYQQFHEAVQKTFPVLESLVQRLGPKRQNSAQPKAPKLDMRSVLGVQHYNDWIYSYNIGDLMIVEPLEMTELKSNMGLQVELTRDMMLDKVCLLAAAYFCVATEVRFLNNQHGSGVKEREGEAWHTKALRVVKDFLPLECPLANHIKQSFTRNYGDTRQPSAKKTRSSVRPIATHLEGSIRGRKSTHPEKSPLAAAKEIVKEMLGRPRSTSGRGQKKQSPKKHNGEVSPKPMTKPVRPVIAYPPKKAVPEAKAKADFAPKDLRTETEYEEEIEQPYFMQGEGVKSVPSLGGDNPIGVGNREKDTTLETEEDEEILVESVRPETLEDDPGSEDSYRDQIVISSNELYGVESDSEDFEDGEKSSWQEEEPVDTKKEKRFEQFRPISSTGGHS